MVELKSKNGQPEVNLLVLDRLVHDYMVEEDLIDDEGTSWTLMSLRPDGSVVVRWRGSVSWSRSLSMDSQPGLVGNLCVTYLSSQEMAYRRFVPHSKQC